MKEFFLKQFYGNTVENWGISLLIILGVFILSKVLYWVTKNIIKRLTSKTKSNLDDILVDMLEEPLITGLVIFGFWLAFKRLDFGENVDAWIGKAFYFAVAIDVTWMISRLVNALLKEYLSPLSKKTKNKLDDQLVLVLQKSTRTVIWVLGIIVALNNAGFDVGALIAGMGIGGLALAMAAKDTVSNIFGGLTVFLDKPFKLNDRIKIDGFDGFIVDIGLRSTRLKTLEGRIVTIPNSHFSESVVENVSLEPSRKVVLNLGLTYDTTPENMQLAMDILEDITKNNSNLESDHLISFTSFGDFALGILYIYYIKKESDIFKTQTDINLEILKRFNDNKLEFAFPTQTIYTSNLDKVN